MCVCVLLSGLEIWSDDQSLLSEKRERAKVVTEFKFDRVSESRSKWKVRSVFYLAAIEVQSAFKVVQFDLIITSLLFYHIHLFLSISLLFLFSSQSHRMGKFDERKKWISFYQVVFFLLPSHQPQESTVSKLFLFTFNTHEMKVRKWKKTQM